MGEQLETALVEILNEAAATATGAKEFVLAEAPEVVEQLLMWHATEALIFFSLGLALCAYGVALVQKGLKLEASEGFEDGIPHFICGVPVGGFGVAFIGANLHWLQIWIAPKLYVLEYAARLAGG